MSSLLVSPPGSEGQSSWVCAIVVKTAVLSLTVPDRTELSWRLGILSSLLASSQWMGEGGEGGKGGGRNHSTNFSTNLSFFSFGKKQLKFEHSSSSWISILFLRTKF